MTDNETVWVAEAYIDGERTEQIVHTKQVDAYHDISESEPNADRYEVNNRQLFKGGDYE